MKQGQDSISAPDLSPVFVVDMWGGGIMTPGWEKSAIEI
jgi:hypothetical protein